MSSENNPEMERMLTAPEPVNPPVKNTTYDMIKLAATLLLPAAGTLYVALAAAWGLPNPEAVGASVLAVNTFLGVLLKILSVKYERSGAAYDGAIVLNEASGKADFVLQNYEDPVQALKDNKKLVFKVLES